MLDPSLLEATGSEPLSYDDEVEMQQSWRNDETKCTFIVHAIEACHYTHKKSETTTEIEPISENNAFLIEDNLDAMIGDVNLFLSDVDDSEESDTNENYEIRAVAAQGMGSSEQLVQAEVDIMIAKRDFQGKGLGRAATCAMLLYGATKLGICRFFCKINEDNTDSIRLFKAIGFEQCNYAACFKQVELELRKTLLEMEEIFKQHGGSYSIIPCRIEK
jgi:RimJ/RimL family protein N-acetyltransferase